MNRTGSSSRALPLLAIALDRSRPNRTTPYNSITPSHLASNRVTNSPWCYPMRLDNIETNIKTSFSECLRPGPSHNELPHLVSKLILSCLSFPSPASKCSRRPETHDAFSDKKHSCILTYYLQHITSTLNYHDIDFWWFLDVRLFLLHRMQSLLLPRVGLAPRWSSPALWPPASSQARKTIITWEVPQVEFHTHQTKLPTHPNHGVIRVEITGKISGWDDEWTVNRAKVEIQHQVEKSHYTVVERHSWSPILSHTFWVA